MQFELTISEYSKVNSIAQMLKRYNIKSVCLTQKEKHINNIAISKELLRLVPELDITLNFSIALNYSEKHHEIESSFLRYVAEANKLKVNKFLIVSGVPKKLYSTIDLLNSLKYKDDGSNKYFCAYNPFLTNNLGEEEKERLRYKLASRLISGVYFQLGDEMFKLKNGIQTSKHLLRGKKVYGSILIPNTFVLNYLKYKKWYGVKYSEEFINDINYANNKTKEILRMYKDNNIEPLIDVIPFYNNNLFKLKQIWRSLT